ncbi:MAG: hypothetical protein VKI81_11805, partial [Synechococcaceae cyanobacterium]|nr:hypothetical protein [Synechococcaceae cyanobacterium]
VTGLLVEPGDPEAAARAVVRLAGDPELADRCRRAASKILSDEFDIDRMVRDLESLYLEVARERGIPS